MKDDIIKWAREAGWSQLDIDSLLYIVETAAAAEREACAAVCEDDPSKAGEWPVDAPTGGYYAEIIRARGQA
jgi:hypothetical protein